MLRQYFTFIIKSCLGLYLPILLPSLSVLNMLINWCKNLQWIAAADQIQILVSPSEIVEVKEMI